MTENDSREENIQLSSLLFLIVHTNIGIPSVKKGHTGLVPDKEIMEYIQGELTDGHKQEIIPSGNITLILDSQELARFSLFTAQTTLEELQEWYQRFDERMEAEPWQFQMGKGATIPQIPSYVNNPDHEVFNPLVEKLNSISTLSGWAATIPLV